MPPFHWYEPIFNRTNEFSWMIGDLLRAEVKAGTPLGNRIKEIISQGKLVSDDIVCEMIDKSLS